MSASQKTTNYELPVYAPTDVTSWLTDFNGAMNKIDAQMKTNENDATDAMSKAASAVSTANAASETANSANATATQAKTLAEQLQAELSALKAKVLVYETTGAGLTAQEYDKAQVGTT